MFPSRFGRKPVTGINSNEQSLGLNKIIGNSRTGRQLQDVLNQPDSINSGQFRRNQDNTRLSRNSSTRKSNTGSSWRKQPTVQQTDTGQPGYTRNNPRNAANKQLKLQPAVVGTNTFQPQLKPTQDASSQRNNAASYQRRLSNVSEQQSEQSSAFCYVSQGNIPRDTVSVDDYRVKQSDIPAISAEQIITVKDFCAFCINKQNFHEATHHCDNCGPFGRYMCQTCLAHHNDFTTNHNVMSLSGHIYRKQESSESENAELLNKSTHPNFVRDISIKTPQDEQSCQITGFCQMENGTIVLTEMNNKAIKTLDWKTYEVTNTMHMENYPVGICCISNTVALVILFKYTIQYVEIDKNNQINLMHQQVLKHDCLCLAFCNKKIYIGSSKSLYIYDEQWNLLDKFTNDLFEDDRIFSDQFSIAVSTSDNVTTVFVADENTGMYAIELVGHDLTTTWKFKDCNTFKACGLCFDGEKNVLLSDRASERLIKMNAEGMILAILLDSHSGIQHLNLPFFDRKNNNLIISLSGKDIIKVFDFK